MRISDVEKLVGVSKKNIRFYEEQGLLQPGREEHNGYRSYSDEDVCRLRLIKLLRQLAVPISEIRGLTEGKITLSDCMERHRIYLDNELKNIGHIKTVCADISSERASLSTLDTEKYDKMISELEQGGVRFVKVSDEYRRSRSRMSAFTVAIVCCLMMFALSATCVWATIMDDEPMPIGFAVFFVGFFATFAAGVLAALRQRLKEIDKGEENEAFKY